jgi:hypothetical protein
VADSSGTVETQLNDSSSNQPGALAAGLAGDVELRRQGV